MDLAKKLEGDDNIQLKSGGIKSLSGQEQKPPSGQGGQFLLIPKPMGQDPSL